MRFSETPIGSPDGSIDLNRFCLSFEGQFDNVAFGAHIIINALFTGVSIKTDLKGIFAKVGAETSASGRKWRFPDI